MKSYYRHIIEQYKKYSDILEGIFSKTPPFLIGAIID